MKALTGTWQQLRLFLRLNRVHLVLWPLIFGGLVWAMAQSLATLYPTQGSRVDYAAINEASPVLKALNGPGHALGTEGGILVFEVGAYLLLAGAIVAVLLLVRHTRTEEESGRSELTGSVPSGPLAALAAGMLGVVALAFLTAGACAGAMLARGLPAAGSLTYGLSLLAVMFLFGAVAAVSAQVSVRAATASGLAGAVVGVAYALRGVGDIGGGALSWASPFGWVQAARPFADERLWPVLLALVGGVALVAVGAALRLRRDDGAGLFPSRPGRAEAPATLTGIWALRCRQIRSPLIGFGLVTVFLASVFGLAGDDVTEVFEASSGLDALLGLDEVSARDAYFSLVITLLMMLVASFGVASVARLRADEESGLAELELSTAAERLPWIVSAVVLSLLGCVLLALAAGLALGGSYAAVSAEGEPSAHLLRATLVQLPAVAVIVALTVALFGLLPRLVAGAWVALGLCAVIGFLGSALQLDQGILDLSPFTHVPQIPSLTPDLATAGLGSVALALAAAGVAGVLRRDL